MSADEIIRLAGRDAHAAWEVVASGRGPHESDLRSALAGERQLDSGRVVLDLAVQRTDHVSGLRHGRAGGTAGRLVQCRTPW